MNLTLPRVGNVLQLFASILKYYFMVNFHFFLLEPIVRFIYSCLYCLLWLGLGEGVLSFIWALWLCVAMGNMDGEMDSEGNACVQTLPDTNWVPALLSNYGIIFPLSFTTRVWKGWEGGGPDPAFLHPILFFITFSLPPHPPSPPPHWSGGWVDIWHLRLECCLSFPKYIH